MCQGVVKVVERVDGADFGGIQKWNRVRPIEKLNTSGDDNQLLIVVKLHGHLRITQYHDW